MRLSRSKDLADDGALPRGAFVAGSPPPLATPQPGEDLFRYIERTAGRFDLDLYRRILGCANEWKEGDAALGIAAPDDASRRHARTLLARTSIGDLDAHPIFEDEVSQYIATAVDPEARARLERDDARRVEGLPAHRAMNPRSRRFSPACRATSPRSP